MKLLEEVNTYFRLGMREEAASSMADFSAIKRRLAEEGRSRPVAPEEGEDVVAVPEGVVSSSPAPEGVCFQ